MSEARSMSEAHSSAGNDRGEGRRRVAGVFLPALLLRDRRVAAEKRCCVGDEGQNVEAAEAIELPEPPREHDGESDFVELNSGPVGSAVNPEILREAAVGALRTREVDQGAASGFDAAAREQRRRRLHHVARPDEVIAAEVIVGFGVAPGDRRRSDECAGVRLVFMREDDVVRNAHELAAVSRNGGKARGGFSAVPLLDEALEVQLIGDGEGLHHARERGVVAVAECDGDGEFAVPGDVDFAHHGEIAVQSGAEVPCHFAVGGEVGKAVGRAHEAAAGAREAAVCTKGERDAVLPRKHGAASRQR